MTQLEISPTAAARSISRRVAMVVRILFAMVIAGGAVSKMSGSEAMVTMFDDIGGGDPMRLFVGAAELVGAIGLFVRPVRTLAAVGLVLLLTGAACTNVVILGANPLLPLALACVAGYLAWVSARRPR